jgi:hypothetical protein
MKYKLSTLILLFTLNVFSQKIDVDISLIGPFDEQAAFDHCSDRDGNFIVVGSENYGNIFYTHAMGRFERENIFVRKYSPDLKKLIISTIVGGSKYEYGRRVAIDSKGNVYVAGVTSSFDFPVTIKAYQKENNSLAEYNATKDVFIIKFSEDLDEILAATYFGGENTDVLNDLKIDKDDNVIITGSTKSETGIATTGTYDDTYNGTAPDEENPYKLGDAFVAKFDNNLEQLLASTYIGTSRADGSSSLVTKENSIVVAGTTNSMDFPTTLNAYQTTPINESHNIFVTELNSDLTQILNSTYIAASSNEVAWVIEYSKENDIYVVGGESTSMNFPVTELTPIFNDNGYPDAFLLTLTGDMHDIQKSTLMGGSKFDVISSIFLEKDLILYGGITFSANMAVSADAIYPDFNDVSNSNDGFFGFVDKDFSNYDYTSFFGGSKRDDIWCISKHNNDIYLSGRTLSEEIESDSIYGGSSDAMLVKMTGFDFNLSEEEKEIARFHISPNPAIDFVSINSVNIKIEHLQIIDIKGRVVLNKLIQSKNKISIDVSQFDAGIYFISINGIIDSNQKLLIR